jgi:UDP-N-acetylglucosamine 2-epimerase (non-hydrolysing)
VLAGALAASKLHIKVGHVEAGLRSFDRTMPEEINRVMADHISDYLFAPTEVSKQNLLKEGIPEDKIYITGNTIVDAVYQNLAIAKETVDIFNKLDIQPAEYFLATVHRAENTDDKKRLSNILYAFKQIHEEYNKPIIFPAHPRTLKMIERFGYTIPAGTKLIEPLGYLEFLQLESQARLLLTDSGGIQEESCILRVPCVTLRDNTERPETVEVGANILLDLNDYNITHFHIIHANKYINPYGNGNSSNLIMNYILNHCDLYEY